MPRDANGTYTLPAGNPVVTGTTIESAWANTTMADIKQALTDSLDRYGRGGMQAPFRFVDGSASAPGMSWASELSTGFYRAGAADMRATVSGFPQMQWTDEGVNIWDGTAWVALSGVNGVNFVPAAGGRMSGNLTIETVSSVALALQVANASMLMFLGRADGAADDKWWAWNMSGGVFSLSIAPDNFATFKSALAFTRNGFDLDRIEYGNATDAPENRFYGEVTLRTAKGLFLNNTDNTFNVGIRNAGGNGSLMRISVSGTDIAEVADTHFGVRSGKFLTLYNGANSVSRSIQCGTADELIVGAAGGLWNWNAANLPRGSITISTTTPAGTGSAGNIVLVYE